MSLAVLAVVVLTASCAAPVATELITKTHDDQLHARALDACVIDLRPMNKYVAPQIDVFHDTRANSYEFKIVNGLNDNQLKLADHNSKETKPLKKGATTLVLTFVDVATGAIGATLDGSPWTPGGTTQYGRDGAYQSGDPFGTPQLESDGPKRVRIVCGGRGWTTSFILIEP